MPDRHTRQDGTAAAGTAAAPCRRCRNLRPRLAAGLGGLSLLLLGRLWTADTLPAWNVCIFKRCTGLPCPGCGMTRSFFAVAHGDLAAAWSHNPFGILVYAGVWCAILWSLCAARIPAAWQQRCGHGLARYGIPAAGLALLLFDLWRIWITVTNG